VKALQIWEFRVLQSAAAAVTHLNDRINTMAADGWECMGISGDQMVYVLLRRPVSEAPAAKPAVEAPPPPPQEPA
jgi:hypothetical protein